MLKFAFILSSLVFFPLCNSQTIEIGNTFNPAIVSPYLQQPTYNISTDFKNNHNIIVSPYPGIYLKYNKGEAQVQDAPKPNINEKNNPQLQPESTKTNTTASNTPPIIEPSVTQSTPTVIKTNVEKESQKPIHIETNDIKNWNTTTLDSISRQNDSLFLYKYNQFMSK